MIEMHYTNAFILLLAQIGSVHSTYFPHKPEGVVVLKSKFHENVTISYKEVSRFYLLIEIYSWRSLGFVKRRQT